MRVVHTPEEAGAIILALFTDEYVDDNYCEDFFDEMRKICDEVIITNGPA